MAESSDVRQGFSSVTRGTLLLLVATLCWISENFVARVVLVRNLTPTAWNDFSLGLAFTGLLIALGTFGVPLAVARSIPSAPNDAERRAVIRNALSIVAVSAAIVSTVMFLLARSIGQSVGDPLLGYTLQLFAVSVAFTTVGQVVASIFQGFEDVRPNAFFVQILNPTLFLIFLAGAYGFPVPGITIQQALYAYVLASAATLGILLVYLLWRLPRVLPTGPRASQVFPKLLHFAAPLFVVTVLGYVTGSADTLVLGIFHETSVGTYSVSLTLARLLQVGMGSLGYIFLPVTTKFLHRRDIASVRVTYTTATKWILLASLPLYLVFFFLPGASLGFVFGSGYALQTLPLQILVLGAFFSTLAGPSNPTQVAFGMTRLLLYNVTVAAAADVALAFLLVPPFGLMGAAIAWATANAIYPTLSVIELAALEDVHPFRPHYLVPLVATGVPMGVLLFFMPGAVPFWVLPPLVLALAGLFLMVVLVTRSVDQGDRLLLEAVEGILGRPLPFVRRLGRWALNRS